MPATPTNERQQPTSPAPVKTKRDKNWQEYDFKKWQESKVETEEEPSSSQSILGSHWTRLGIILIFVVVTIIIACSVRPLERIVIAILPDLERNETVAPISVLSGSDLYASATITSTTDRESFAFNQCHSNATSCCNGLENACNLKINDLMFATLHKASAAQEDGALLRPNHLYSLESALEAGYRGLHLEVCKCNGVYQFCHGICNLGARNPTEVFLNMDRFLRDHSQEVLLVHLELKSNVHQEIVLSEVYDVMKNATRFSRYLYSHQDPKEAWPTLGSMIESNKRILLFHSHGPSCTNEANAKECPEGMHSWLDYVWESEALKGLGNADWEKSCSTAHRSREDAKNKTTTVAVTTKPFFSANHFFLEQPHSDVSRELNEFDVVAKRMEACSSLHEGLQVNFVSADFWHLGSIVEFVQRQNKAKSSK